MNITIFGKATISLLASIRVINVLKGKTSKLAEWLTANGKEVPLFIADTTSFDKRGEFIYQQICKCISESLEWLEGMEKNVEDFYDNQVKKLEWGYYSRGNQYREAKAFDACFDALYVVCHAMHLKEKISMDSIIVEVTIEVLYNCLSSAQQASENPEAEKAWQESVIARLLQDHYTDDPEEFGKPISREYMEELLGEKLPF